MIIGPIILPTGESVMFNKSKRLKQATSQIEVGKRYEVKEAVGLLKKLPVTKFDQSVELHFKLGVDIKQANQQVRGSVTLPSGLGKNKRIAVFCSEAKEQEALKAGATVVGGEELIKTIGQTGKCDFEVAVATPEMMKKMAPIAKILGQKGLMPNPKTDTITSDVGRVVKELNSGKINFKIDDTGNIHQMVGKLSFSADQLQTNVETLIQAVQKARPTGIKGIYIRNLILTSTMGPAIKIAI